MAWITKEKRLAIYIRDGFKCGYCETDLRDADPSAITLDHLAPRCKGGKNGEWNLVTSCRPCNCVEKHMKDWKEYATPEAIERIEYLRYQPLNIALAKTLLNGTAGDEEAEARQ